jgi:hypothetical protein
MKIIKLINQHVPILFTAIATLFSAQAYAAYKCQGADGKVEYSDRACETNKNTLDQPKSNTGVTTRPIGNPMEQLEKIFVDYAPRLCEREKLAVELDAANRKGDVASKPAVWKNKQDRLIELNEVLVDFQARASKITKPAGNDSKEMAALRKFQLWLKDCDVTKPYVIEPKAEIKPDVKPSPKSTAAPSPTK